MLPRAAAATTSRRSRRWHRAGVALAAVCGFLVVPVARATVIDDYERFLESQRGRGGALALPPGGGESGPVARHLESADRHYRAGRIDAAVREVERARELVPASMSIATALADLYLRAGRNEEALRTARVVQAAVPASAQAHAIAGSALLAMGNATLAAREFEELVRKAPGRTLGYRRLGDAYWALGRPAEALAQYEMALERAPRSVDAAVKIAAVGQELGDPPQRALERARRAVGLAPGHALARALLGNALLAAGRPREAQREYAAAVRLQPRYTYFLERLAAAHARLDEPAQAIAAYRRVLARDPAHVGAHRELSSLYRAANEPGLAEYHLGVLALAAGSPAKAIEHYGAALRHDPKLKGAYLDLAAVHLRQKNPGAAAAAAERALEIDGKDATAWSLLGRSRRAAGNPGEAEKKFRQAIAVDPGYWPAYVHLADLLRESGRCEEAVGYYSRAAGRSQSAAPVYRKLGDCYQALGRSEDAARAYRAAGPSGKGTAGR
ncbi:MAG: tetratricopeptide repeat protein [Burkholderiales bacterium]|nr:tetratricopeptide repeat protein [Burkholderiales bacterium]